MFVPGKNYIRQRDLHDKYGGNRQSGIAVCASHPIIFIFTSPRGEEFGYRDGWISNSRYRYFGEGQYGDMEMVRGNLAIRDHVQNGKSLYLFKKVEDRIYTFIGEMRYQTYREEMCFDAAGQKRRCIVFILEKFGQALMDPEDFLPSVKGIAEFQQYSVKLNTSESSGEPEQSIEIRIRFNAYMPAARAEQQPRHAMTSGVVQIVPNTFHQITPDGPMPFWSLMELNAVIERALLQQGIHLHMSDAMSEYVSE